MGEQWVDDTERLEMATGVTEWDERLVRERDEYTKQSIETLERNRDSLLRDNCMTCRYHHGGYGCICSNCRINYEEPGNHDEPKQNCSPPIEREYFAETRKYPNLYNPVWWFLQIEQQRHLIDHLYDNKERMFSWKDRSLQKFRIIKKIKELMNKQFLMNPKRFKAFLADLTNILKGQNDGGE